MRKIILLAIAIFTCCAFAYSQESEDIIKEIIIQGIESKISQSQEQIGFEDDQAEQLRETELTYYLGVQKIKKCFLCNKKKRINKLKQARDKQLQEILERDEYIKYSAIENNLIKNIPVYLK